MPNEESIQMEGSVLLFYILFKLTLTSSLNYSDRAAFSTRRSFEILSTFL